MSHLFVYLFFTVTTTDDNKNIPIYSFIILGKGHIFCISFSQNYQGNGDINVSVEFAYVSVHIG